MTGFGEAHCQRDGLVVTIEVRTINSRFFKLSLRAGEGYGSLEPQIEDVVRRRIRRGTVQVNLWIDRLRSPEDFKINAEVLDRYRQQLGVLMRQWSLRDEVPVEALLPLPGVVDDHCGSTIDAAADWPVIGETLEAALENLARMRKEEGRAMAADLKANKQIAADSLAQIQLRAPRVVESYRARLTDRLNKALAEYQVALDPADLIKEVSLYAERGDISEEIVRLQSHLDQFETIMNLPESSGRKLEFLTQEMVRETNTIGSKANDVEIARHVIEIKTVLERIREMIQNVE
jgi:uncharacterized protein (TIGR00255 family)